MKSLLSARKGAGRNVNMKMKTMATAVAMLSTAAWAAIEVIPPPVVQPPPAGGETVVPVEPGMEGAVAAIPGAGVIELMNGDRLTGTVESMDAATGLLSFRHESMRDPMAVALIGIDRFNASSRPADATPASNWAVELTNGDRLRGELVSLTDKTLELETWYSGRIQMDRALVRSAAHTAGVGTVYEGPGNAEGWKAPRGKPRFSENTVDMSSNVMIGRELDRMPPKSRIDFEIRWFAYCYFMCHFYADQPASMDGNSGAYMLTIQGNSRVELNRITPNSGQSRIGQANIQGLENESQQFKARITIFTDLESRKLVVYVNDKPVGDWTDPQPFTGKGKCLSFASMQGNPLSLRGVRVSEWDGRLPAAGAAAPAAGGAQGEVLSLRNGDTLTGELKTIREGKAQVGTSFGNLDIPMDRVDFITFAKNDARARRTKGDARLTLWDETVVTLDLSSLTNGTFEGKSENMGSMRIPLKGVRTAQWNLYSKRKNKPDDEKPLEGQAGNAVIIRGGGQIIID